MILFQADIPYISSMQPPRWHPMGYKLVEFPLCGPVVFAVTWQDLDRASTPGPASYIDHLRRSDHDFDVALACDSGVAFDAVFSDGVVLSSWALTSRKW